MAEEEPHWLRNSNSSTPAPASSASAASKPIRDENGSPHRNKIKFGVFLMNLGCSFFMAATGALGVGSADSISDTGTIFVGIYMILFAAIEFIYEISQYCPTKALDDFMKKNFGFLYGEVGKGLFIMFMGILAFGLSKPRNLAIACGIIVAAWGIILIFLKVKFPEYFEKKEKYLPK